MLRNEKLRAVVGSILLPLLSGNILDSCDFEQEQLFRLQILPLDFGELGDEFADFLGVVVTAIGGVLHRIDVLPFQLPDAVFDCLRIIGYRFVPHRRMTAASGSARAPIDRYGIRPVNGLPDKDRIMHVQFDAFDNRKQTPKPTVFVEPFGRSNPRS